MLDKSISNFDYNISKFKDDNSKDGSITNANKFI